MSDEPRAAARSIRKASEADVPTLAVALARAFYDDPPGRWVFRDDATRLRRLERGFHLAMRRLWLEHGECWTTEGLEGGAFWDPPGRWKIGLGRQLRFLPAMVGAYGRDLPRLLRMLSIYESRHPDDRPHFYLALLGVQPESQGRGTGTALMAPVLERCDRERTGAYLEASTARSRVCYERVGFEVTEEIELPDGPTLFGMWRDPQPA